MKFITTLLIVLVTLTFSSISYSDSSEQQIYTQDLKGEIGLFADSEEQETEEDEDC